MCNLFQVGKPVVSLNTGEVFAMETIDGLTNFTVTDTFPENVWAINEATGEEWLITYEEIMSRKGVYVKMRETVLDKVV